LKIHALINYSIADLGTIEEWANDEGHTITTSNAYENDTYPELHDLDMLIILGGIMGAYEEDKFPWLISEKKFIKKAIEANKIVLGICLGAQLIADVLGGKALPHTHQEIGWWKVKFNSESQNTPIFKNLPKELEVFQFHGDTYELPNEAVCIAGNTACKNQAFIYKDRVVGLQFHPEFNEEKLQEIVSIHGDEVKPGGFVQLPEEFLGKTHYHKTVYRFLYSLLNNIENHLNS